MPYLFVENGGSGNASGSFTLRMTLTDPATGYSATATKKFTVTAGSGAAQVSAFVEKNRSFFELGSLGLGSMGRDAKKNAILTKNGIIIRRDNADGGLAEGTFGRADLASAKDACSLQFEMRVLGVNASGAAQIGIGLETGSKDSMAGFVEIGMADGRIAVTHTLSGVREFRAEEMPELALGERISVRLERSKSGDAAMYILYVQTKTANVECLRLICTATSKASSAGAPIAGFRFDHRGFGGCSMVENVLLHA